MLLTLREWVAISHKDLGIASSRDVSVQLDLLELPLLPAVMAPSQSLMEDRSKGQRSHINGIGARFSRKRCMHLDELSNRGDRGTPAVSLHASGLLLKCSISIRRLTSLPLGKLRPKNSYRRSQLSYPSEKIKEPQSKWVNIYAAKYYTNAVGWERRKGDKRLLKIRGTVKHLLYPETSVYLT